jgi:WD40 repeat protein
VVSLPPPLPSYYVTLKKQEATQQCIKSQIPFVDLQVASGRVRKVEGNAVKDFYVSKLSPSGNVLLSASYSTISLVRTSDMAILDVVGMRKGWVSGPSDPSILIEFSPDGRRVLVTGRTSKLIRVFDIFDGLQYQNRDFIEQIEPISSELIAETVQRQRQPKEEGSLFFTSISSSHLRLTRVFEASIEKCGGWAAAAFSPDGSHIVGAISSDDEHVMYIWNVEHGYAASTLQAGVGGIEVLCWHPRPVPAQLLAVCSTGKICVWAKILSQWWSAFAPDFETLAENREHNETETEFDVELKERFVKGEEDTMECDDDIIDIMSWDWLESGSSRKGASSRMWDPKQKQTERLIAMPVQLW